MANNNGLYTREDVEFVKRLLVNGVYFDEFVNRFGFSTEQITAMFQSFRQSHFRIFLNDKCGEPCLVLKEDYMKEKGYNSKIITPTLNEKVLVIADTHFGSFNDNPRIMDKIYNFCKAEGISIIIHLGDVIEGKEYYVKPTGGDGLRYSMSDENQLAYLQGCLPYDKGIKMYVLQGNHDQYSNDGIALDTMGQFIEAYGRKDINIVGFDYAELQINSDTLYLNHGYLKEFSAFEKVGDCDLILSGHSHRSKIDYNPGQGYVAESVTTLSNIEHTNKAHPIEDNQFFVGFDVLDISFNDNKTFNTILINRYKMSTSLYSKPRILPSPTVINFSRTRK